MNLPDNYPDKLVSAVNKYLKENKGSKIFHYDSYTSKPYKDKTIINTTYKVFILWGNLFEVIRYKVCSKPEWSFDDVVYDSLLTGEIKICYEKYRQLYELDV